MIFFRASKYLKYKLLSRHRKGHGIHSPFVFDLICRVFRNKTDDDIVCTIERIRKKMISDKRSINVKDLGAGYEKYKTNIRKVSQIARNSSVPEKYGILLSNMSAEFGDSLIVELGTSLGISTMYMATAKQGVVVKTVEGCPATTKIAMENFVDAGIENIEVINGSFDAILPDIINEENRLGLVFIDGNHRKEPVIKYFMKIAEVSDSKTVVIIDDIYYSSEMEEAWNEIKRFGKVSVTVDIFRMGIVFFREGIAHNNYIIRY
jgi:predicted O-methyltransferase YrrM